MNVSKKQVLVFLAFCLIQINTKSLAQTSIGGEVNSDQTICIGSQPANLNLVNYSGSILYWQRDDNSAFSSPTTISSIIDELQGSLIGSLNETTYIRAVVQNGSSPIDYSTYATLTVNSSPLGDGFTYGDNEWIGYVYTNSGLEPSNPDVFSLPYSGYITQNEVFDQDISISNLSSPTICGSFSNYFAVRYKMIKSFSPGYYKLSVGADESFRLSVNGGLTFIIDNWDNTSYNLVTELVYLDGSTELVLEYYETTGSSRVNFDFEPCGATSTPVTSISGSTIICEGSSTTLSANGATLALGAEYQWGTGNVVGENIIASANTNSITVTPSISTNYWVRILDDAPCNLISSDFQQTVTVVAQPVLPSSITGNSTICSNQSSTLTANGASGNIQWQSSSDNINFFDINGATNNVLTLNNIVSNSYYRVRVSSLGACTPLVSNSFEVTVISASVAGTASGSSIVCAGTNSSTLTLSSYNGNIQWQSSSDGENFSNISGETGSSFEANNLNTSTYYRAIVTNGICISDASNILLVTVKSETVSGTISGPSYLCSGVNSTTLNLTGSNGNIQWQSSSDGISFSNVSGATTTNFVINNLEELTYYRVFVTNSPCASTYSDVFSLDLNESPIAGSTSGGAPVCSGTNSTTLNVAGSNATIQWQSSTDNLNFSIISGANSSTYNATNLNTTTFFRVVTNNGFCNSVPSNVTPIVVLTTPVGGTINGGSSVCSSINSTEFNLSGHSGNIQWQSSTDNVNFSNIGGQTNLSYTATNVSTTTYYRVLLSNGNCTNSFSDTATVNYSVSIAGTISGATTVCPGINSTLLTLNGHSGSIQWQSSLDNITYNDILSATNSTYTSTNISQATYYRVLISNGSCDPVFSAPIILSLANGAVAGTIATPSGGVSLAAGLERRTLQVSGYVGTIQWQSSTDNINFTNISGATSETYITGFISQTTYYRVVFSQGSCTAVSSTLTLSICTPTGNPTVFPSGTAWRAYVYALHSGGSNPSDAFTTTYQGYYSQTEQFGNAGISTTASTLCGSNNGTFTTAAYNSRNTAVRMRLRRNFAAGTYTFLVGASASYRFSMDGGTTWLISNFNRANVVTFASNTVTVTLAAGNQDLVLEYVQSVSGMGSFTFRYCTGSSSYTAPTSIVGNLNMQIGTNTTLVATGGTGAGSIFQWGTGSVIGSNIISGTSGIQIVYPTSTTTYWVRKYDAACDSYTSGITRTVTVNTSTPVTPNGNTTDYGNGVWIGYVYGSSAGQASSFATAFSPPYKYSGYLTTSSDQFSFNQTGGTAMPTNSLWNQTTHTTTSGYFDNLYSIRFKMNKNFTPGYYTFTISADDGMRFSVDGGSTWIIDRWAWTPDGTTNTYSVFLNGSTNLVLDFNGGIGGQSLNFSYVACTNYSTAPTTITSDNSVCTGQSLTLVASGGTTGANGLFEWGTGSVVGSNIISGSSNSISVSPATTTTYWVRRKDVGGNCRVSTGTNTNSNTNIRVTSDATTSGVTKTITVDALTVAGNLSGGNTTVCSGTNSNTLSITGQIGTNYQWQSSNNNVNFTNIDGETSTSLTATNLTSTTFYRVSVTNGSCNTALTPSTSITVNSASQAGTIAGASSVCEGINSNTLTLSGNNGSIQWQSSTDDVNFTNISDAVSSNLVITNLAATTYYRASVVNGVCNSVNSNSVSISVTPYSVTGTISGGEGTVCATSNSSTLNLNGNLGSIQWQSSSDNNTFTNISGENSSSLNLTNLNTTTYYRAIVTNGVCPSTTTSSTSIFVDYQPLAGTLSGGTTVCSGSNLTNLQLTGSLGSIIWQSSINNVDFSTISGITNQNYSASNLSATTYYRAIVNNGVCGNVTSNTATVTVSPNSVAGTISGAGTYCQGSQVNLSISGNTGTIQWNSSTDNINFSPISGATSSTYSTSSLAITTYFTATSKSGVCSSITTTASTVVINPTSNSGTISGEASYCTTTNSTVLSLSGSVGSIQWQSSTDDVNFTTISGATSPTYNALNLQNTTYYRVVVTSGVCSPSTSVSTPIFVGDNSVGGTISPSNQTICSGSQPTNLTLSGYVGSIVKWQRSTNPSFTTVTDILVTSSTLPGSTIGNLSTATYFRAIVQLGDCASAFSSSATVLVSANSVGGTVSSSQTICSGSTPSSLVLTGNTGAVIRWEIANNVLFTGATTINNTTNTLSNTSIGALTETRFIRAIVQNTFCNPTNSNTVTITVNSTTVAGNVSDNQEICSGSQPNSLTLSGNNGSVVRWQRASDLNFTNPIDIVNSSTTLSGTTINTMTESTYFRAVVKNGSCLTENSSPVLITVSPTTVSGTVSGNQTICSTSLPSTLTLSGNVGNVLNWQSSSDINFTSPSDILNTNSTLSGLEIGNLNASTYFRAILKSGACSTENSNSILISVDVAPIGGTINGNSNVCIANNSTTLTLSGNSGTISKWQYAPVLNFSSGVTDVANTNSTLTVNNLTSDRYYRAVLENGVCDAANSTTHTISVITPSLPSVSLSNGDYIWKGNYQTDVENQDWQSASNWFTVNNGDFTIASSLPTISNNIFITSDGVCFYANPTIFSSTAPICRNLTILSDGSLTMQTGKLAVAGNWVNDGSFTIGSGEVEFIGNGNHTIGGSAGNHNFFNLEINKSNSGSIRLAKAVTVHGDLTLTTGLIDLDAFNLNVKQGNIIGGNTTCYVHTSGSGYLMRNVGISYSNTDGGFVRFPIGRGKYNPIHIQNTGVDDIFRVRIFDKVTDDANESSSTTTLPAVDRTWLIEEQNPGGSLVNMRLFWNRNDEEINNFDISTAYIAHFDQNQSSWEMKGGTTIDGNDYIETSNVTSFSPFAISSRWGLGYVSPLPVELIHFSGKCLDENTKEIEWSTASENNSSHFELLKSTNGNDWTILNHVSSAGNSIETQFYSVIDESKNATNSYYKLKQVDFDGESKIYEPIFIDCQINDLKSELTSFPNPSDNSFILEFKNSNLTENGIIRISDLKGTVLYTRQIDLNDGLNQIYMENLQLERGIYLIYIESKNVRTNSVKQIIK